MKYPLEDRDFTASANFDCHWQCVECGLQRPPQIFAFELAGYRDFASSGPEVRLPREPCGHCGALAWANLREGAVVEALIVQDDARQAAKGAGRKGLFELAFLAVWGMLVALAMAQPELLLLKGFGLIVLALMVHRVYADLRSDLSANLPNSWAHASGPESLGWHLSRERELGRGRVGLARDCEGLRAPLSGRMCAAYELGVRHDSDGDASPRSWTLLEQRSAGLTIGGEPLSESPYLRLQRQVFEGTLSPAARRELRKRGLDPARPGYTLFETVVGVGEVAMVCERGHSVVLDAAKAS